MRNREEKKCKKGQESTIGKIIYGFLLFMPLLAIFITCGYAIFNKNAYRSYENVNETEYVEITNVNQFQVGEQYCLSTGTFDIKDTEVPQGAYVRGISVNNFTSLGTNLNLPTEVRYVGLYINNTGNLQLQLIGDTTKEFTFNDANGNYLTFTFNYMGDSLSYNFAYNNLFTQVVRNEESFISNVFYYSVDKVQQSNLFNWAQNSVIYTTTNATCNALSINNTFIPLLLSYWLIISVLYFLYDIALMLVWIVHKKIHELQENF